MGLQRLSIICLLLCGFCYCNHYRRSLRLPDYWLFGASSAAPQVEGAWNEDGKGESAWDRYTHKHPEAIKEGANMDIAADFYHHYKDDIARVKQMGLNTFRFSIAWTRILPEGHTNHINSKGIKHYHRVLDECEKHGIIPLVNIEYWDIPSTLVDMGGWLNSLTIQYFLDYCELLFEEFGHRVKWWLTFNEPTQMARGYDGNSSQHGFAPNISLSGIGPYIVVHNALLAHAKAYRLYHEKYAPKQKGKISLIIETAWYEPKDPCNPEDVEAAELALIWNIGWIMNPIFSEEGDYPQVMKERIAAQSKEEGFWSSRLPEFTQEEIECMKGTADFIAINHYTTYKVTKGTQGLSPSKERDCGIIEISPPEWPGSEEVPWLRTVPAGLRKVINWIWNKYGGSLSLIVTENGFIDGHDLNDVERCKYLGTYILETLKAIYYDGVKVIGYLAWSLLDSFEWNSGYTSASGLYHVDMQDRKRKRIPRDSARLMKYIAHSRKIPQEFVDYSSQLERMQFPRKDCN